MKQVAVYVRVSSKQQDERSQEPELSRWVKAQESEVIWYRDNFTGKTMQRPGMEGCQGHRGRQGQHDRHLASGQVGQNGQGTDRVVRGPTSQGSWPRQSEGWPGPGNAGRQVDGERARECCRVRDGSSRSVYWLGKQRHDLRARGGEVLSKVGE